MTTFGSVVFCSTTIFGSAEFVPWHPLDQLYFILLKTFWSVVLCSMTSFGSVISYSSETFWSVVLCSMTASVSEWNLLIRCTLFHDKLWISCICSCIFAWNDQCRSFSISAGDDLVSFPSVFALDNLSRSPSIFSGSF